MQRKKEMPSMQGLETKGMIFSYLILKSKCEYQEVHLPCTVCKQRGYECGDKQKVWGQIRQIESILTQSSLSANDKIDILAHGEHILQSFKIRLEQQKGIIIASGRNQEYVRVMGISSIAYPFPEEYPWSSKCSQYALIAMESSRQSGGKYNQVTAYYYQKGLESIGEAISTSALIEVLMASYAMLMYTCFSEYESFRATVFFYNGISAACLKLIEQPFSIKSKCLPWASKLWLTSLQLLEISYWSAVRRSLLDPSGQYGFSDDIYSVILCSFGLTCLEKIQGWRPFRSEICATEPLRTNLMFCLDYYLASKTCTLPGKDSRDRSCSAINRILRQIIVQTPQRDSIRRVLNEAMNSVTRHEPHKTPQLNSALQSSISVNDVCDTLLFGIAKLIQKLMEFEYENTGISEAFPTAEILCRLCALSIHHTGARDLLLTYGLFLAGLVIRARINFARTNTSLLSTDIKVNRWIREQLQVERECRRRVFDEQGDHANAVYDSLFAMLDLVDSRMDYNIDIFSLESEGISVFSCHRMLGSLSCFPC
jgi:hypothetical protein